METPGAEAALVVRQGEIAASNTSLEQRTRKFFFNLRKFYPPIRVAQGNTGRQFRTRGPPFDQKGSVPPGDGRENSWRLQGVWQVVNLDQSDAGRITDSADNDGIRTRVQRLDKG